MRLRLVAVALGVLAPVLSGQDRDTVRVFLFAGQSNMEGADSKVADIERFPPFHGLGEPQKKVRFAYCIGREDKTRSDGWETLGPVKGMVGPELSFARRVATVTKAPIAIIKVAAGGTTLGGDWNPDEPQGFELYPLALEFVKDRLAELKKRKVRYRIEGFLWHQGENDMFVKEFMPVYGKNLKNYLACWRRDLGVPDLRFYIGELCTKTIWGMDLRPRMHAIATGQREVTDADPLADYVETAHVGVEIGGGVGLHYHYGTLGQLEHGENYATAYLRNTGELPVRERPLKAWPYARDSKVRLFVLAGHRNMEGERAFVQELKPRSLRRDDHTIAFRYSLGDGYRKSDGWEPLGPAGYYDTFGPELSFGTRLKRKAKEPFAIAKFTHSGSQLLDWTPTGSMAKPRNLYPRFVAFVRDAVADLESRGHEVEIAGILYHAGENDMSFGPHRKNFAKRLQELVAQTRQDLELPTLPWFVSQQRPTDHERVNRIDVSKAIAEVAERDANLVRVEVFDLPGQEQQLVIRTPGIVELGQRLADAWLARR
ncbi:MAG: sialate O-acetylesterase [bacterium]|nr:sialate O-acetylesterase [bacterium]